MERDPAVDLGHRAPERELGQRDRAREQEPHDRVALDDAKPARHVEPRGRDGHDALELELLALGQPQRQAAAERVAHRDRAAVGCHVAHDRLAEAVELRQHLARA